MDNTTFKDQEYCERSEVVFDKAQATYFNPYARMYVPSDLEELNELTEIELVEEPGSEGSQQVSTFD